VLDTTDDEDVYSHDLHLPYTFTPVEFKLPVQSDVVSFAKAGKKELEEKGYKNLGYYYPGHFVGHVGMLNR
jgi:hypothetical protein